MKYKQKAAFSEGWTKLNKLFGSVDWVTNMALNSSLEFQAGYCPTGFGVFVVIGIAASVLGCNPEDYLSHLLSHLQWAAHNK